MKAKYNWESINWQEQDIIISRQLGCNRERVRQKRLQLNVGRSLFHHKRRNCVVLDKLLSLDTENMTLDEIAVKVECSKIYVRGILKRHNKSFIFIDKRKIGKYDWNKADWNRTDKEVAAYLGVPNSGTVTQHRRRMGIIKQRIKITKASKKRTCWYNVDKLNKKVLDTMITKNLAFS